MNTTSQQFSNDVSKAERPFARKGFALRLSQLYPQLDEASRSAVVTVLTDQIYKKSMRYEHDLSAILVANGIPEQDCPLMLQMVSDMTAAFIGLGSDILELGPEVIKWTPRPE